MEEAHKERRIKTVLNLKRDMEANEVRLRLCVICAHLEVTVRILYFAISCILPVVTIGAVFPTLSCVAVVCYTIIGLHVIVYVTFAAVCLRLQEKNIVLYCIVFFSA